MIFSFPVLSSASTYAAEVVWLWWVLLGASLLMSFAIILPLLWRFLRRSEDILPSEMLLKRGVVASMVLTLLVLLVAAIATTSVNPQVTAVSTPLQTIQVVGHQYWWEVHYFSEHDELLFTTANEIHIPTNQPVRFLLESADVVHSFWVPELGQKMDLIPGHTNEIVVEAAETGAFRGPCTEFCGAQHAFMALLVIAQKPADYQRWLVTQQEAAVEPATEEAQKGQRIFNRSCALCHLVRRTARASDNPGLFMPGPDRVFPGPDLTHLKSRRTLAAATLPNSKGNLAGWIQNPQQIKPGNKMPALELPPEEFLVLLGYLETLE